jgi:hypothetical protein
MTAAAKPTPQLVRQDGRTFLAGMEKLAWRPEQTNSVMRTVAIAMQTAGHKQYTYQYLMGASGLAFRFQTHKDGWCPSSPHACCGQLAIDRLDALLPYEVIEHRDFWDRHKQDPSILAAMHKDIRASIDRGIPVPFGSEENGLIVGYTDDGKLLGRNYGDRGEPGIKEITQVAWGYMPWGKAQQPPAAREVAIESLKTAVMLAHARRINGYDEGFYALTNYVARLRDAKAYEDPDESKRPGHLGNAFIYECFCDARSQAAGYLASIRGEFGAKAAAEIDAAAGLYTQIAARLADPCPVTIAPYPWMKDRPWTQELRNRQADIMESCLALERQAVAHLEAALAAEGVDAAPLKAPVTLVAGKRVKACANWMTMPGCMVRCADAMRMHAPPEWVFGAGGFAFAMNIHYELCPSGPTAWRDHNSYPLLANVGLKVRSAMASKNDPQFAAKQAEVVVLIRDSIAAGKPAVVWEMDVPDWYVCVGYEGDDLLFLDWGGATRRLPATKLGNTVIGFACAVSAERGERADLHKTLRDAVAFALDNAAGKHRSNKAYHAGLEAYDVWIKACGDESLATKAGVGFGAAYNAACWSECRRMAAGFLKLAAARTGEPELVKALNAAATHYQKVADHLTAVHKLLPFDAKDQPKMAAQFAQADRRAKVVAELQAASAAEAQGLESLKAIAASPALLNPSSSAK